MEGFCMYERAVFVRRLFLNKVLCYQPVFPSFHHRAPTLSPGILARREAYVSVVIIKDRALQDSEDVSYNGTQGVMKVIMRTFQLQCLPGFSAATLAQDSHLFLKWAIVSPIYIWGYYKIFKWSQWHSSNFESALCATASLRIPCISFLMLPEPLDNGCTSLLSGEGRGRVGRTEQR